MKGWPYAQETITKDDIELYVKDPDWQQLRVSLKGMSTESKLDHLEEWLATHNYCHAAKVQVQNYINSLRRGGQLSTHNKAVR